MSDGARWQLVDSPEAWRGLASVVGRAERIAVDIEADGYHRYPERVALVQLALPDGTILIVDPLEVTDLAPLGDVLADPAIPKVFHSADYDLRSLDRDYGYHVAGLFDTALAAQLCGCARMGLGNVLAEFAGIALPKPKQLQRLDWSRRPLAPDALRYAADDVAYLFVLADTLTDRLSALGRTAWLGEECRRLQGVRYHPPDPPAEACLAIPGARDLTDAGRGVLRALCVWRDAEARRVGKPPYMLVGNDALLALAAAPDGDLGRLSGVNRGWLAGVRSDLAAVLADGRAAAPVPWPRRPRGVEWTPEVNERLKRLKGWRTTEALARDLDPGVMWPVDHLKQVALHHGVDTRSLDHGDPPCVRDWQWSELGMSLELFRRDVLGDRPA